MNGLPDYSDLRPVSEPWGDDPEQRQGRQELWTKAEAFLGSLSWCEAVQNAYEGIAIAGVMGVYLVHIKPAREGIDEWLWVVVGDLPPAYLVTDDAPDPLQALEIYIAEMRRWIAAVEAGEGLDDVIPVNAPPDSEHARMLKVRLDFLADRIIAET
jgi:hypothetical protein